MNLDLKNKNAFIGGSSKGIGKAIALELAALGATVTLVSRSEELLKSGISELDNSQGQQHDYLVADFSDPKQLESNVKKHLANTGKQYHILINNTGGPPGGPITGF
jgi:3-oxoacyl-[acyl-carrier protein] reductase